MKKERIFAGTSLIFGCILLIITMVLHPSGGSIEHILKVKTIIVVSHSIAIISLPFICFGSWGLTILLKTSSQLSYFAFIFICFGLVAAMIAGTINGITLPLFLSENSSTDPSQNQMLKYVCSYGNFINIPMDYIMIISFSITILIWSFLIIRTKRLSRYIGFFGIILIVLGMLLLFNAFNLVNLFGFSIFILGISSWIILVGYNLVSCKVPNEITSN
ncbi:MAG: hypothetical protein IPM34_06140 [Saprospiraceae bacterium]|nr:hypothetical protein [Saprospiraceae bacterium]